jgi:hypothetical protein
MVKLVIGLLFNLKDLHLDHLVLSLCTNNLSALPDHGYTRNNFAIFPESNIHADRRRTNSVLGHIEIANIQTGPGATQSLIKWLLRALFLWVKQRGDESRTENITGNTRRKEPILQTYM